MTDTLKTAVKAWVRAEHRFRMSNDPNVRYSAKAQEDYVQAEEEMREALTGETDLLRAFIVIRREDKKHDRRKDLIRASIKGKREDEGRVRRKG